LVFVISPGCTFSQHSLYQKSYSRYSYIAANGLYCRLHFPSTYQKQKPNTSSRLKDDDGPSLHGNPFTYHALRANLSDLYNTQSFQLTLLEGPRTAYLESTFGRHQPETERKEKRTSEEERMNYSNQNTKLQIWVVLRLHFSCADVVLTK
jgi:hypothetical protein